MPLAVVNPRQGSVNPVGNTRWLRDGPNQRKQYGMAAHGHSWEVAAQTTNNFPVPVPDDSENLSRGDSLIRLWLLFPSSNEG